MTTAEHNSPPIDIKTEETQFSSNDEVAEAPQDKMMTDHPRLNEDETDLKDESKVDVEACPDSQEELNTKNLERSAETPGTIPPKLALSDVINPVLESHSDLLAMEQDGPLDAKPVVTLVESIGTPPGPEEPSEIQTNRNLFETVGLALRVPSEHQRDKEQDLDHHQHDQKTEQFVQELIINGSPKQEDKNDQQDTGVIPPKESVITADEPSIVKLESTELETLSEGQSCVETTTKNITEDVKPSICNFCGFSAPTPEIFEKHMVHHDKSKGKYSCFLCSVKEPYSDRQAVINHFSEIHGVNDLYLCGECTFVSLDAEAYREHVRNHFIRKPFACKVCHMTLTTTKGLLIHMAKSHSEGMNKPQIVLLNKKRDRPTTSENALLGKSNKRAKHIQSSENTSSSSLDITQNTTLTESQDNDQSQEKFHVLPSKSIVLQCAFCGVMNKDKADLADHLLSVHRSEQVTWTPLSISSVNSIMLEES